MQRRADGRSCVSQPVTVAHGSFVRMSRAAHSCSNGWVGRSMRCACRLGADTRILVSAAARIWRPAPDCGLPTGTTKARWLAEFITTTWAELDQPCSERAIEDSLACARRRGDAHRDETAVLVHGDVHQWNALAAADGFRAAWTPTASSPNLNTTSASSCAKTRSRETCAHGHATSQARPASIRTQSGNGASSSGCRPACSRPAWGCSHRPTDVVAATQLAEQRLRRRP